MYARQHYVLATTGKLGQKISGKGAPKSGSSTHASHGKSMKSGGSGSYGRKGSSRA